MVLWEAKSPAALTYKADGADTVRNDVRRAAGAVKLAWKETNALVLRRGPYLVAAALDESVPRPDAPLLKGRYVDLRRKLTCTGAGELHARQTRPTLRSGEA